MSNNDYVKIPRSLRQNIYWKGLTLIQREIFLVLVEHAVFKDQQFNDHGIIIDLKPGQICVTLRELVKWCDCKGVKLKQIENGIKKLIECGFLGLEVRHRKSVFTIRHKDTYDLIKNEFGTSFGTRLGQDWDKIGTEKNNDNKDNNVNKDNNNNTHAAVFFSCLNEIDISDSEKAWICKTYSQPDVEHAVKWVTHPLTEITSTLIAALKWACKAQPEIPTKKSNLPYWEANLESVKKIFEHGKFYNQAECFISSDSIAFQRGMVHIQIKFKDMGFKRLLEDGCQRLGIELYAETR